MDKLSIPYTAKDGDLTIGELRKIINMIPLDLDDRNVWIIDSSSGLSNCIYEVFPLNKSERGFDVVLCPKSDD